MSHRHDQIECVETHRIRGGACRDFKVVRVAPDPEGGVFWTVDQWMRYWV